MTKFIPLILFGLLFIASCTHNNVDDHFQKLKPSSMTGWPKSQVIQHFGSPNESYEDSNFSYYIYHIVKSTENKNSRIWHVKYIFQFNKLIKVEENLIPKSEELDKLNSEINNKKIKHNK